ncbi:LacI family DNA-binding transcriptional regulator [Galbitalea soli]|uniref:LacI family transcriptional regulator n=1 Tax=Galbitalea soli TaxID=1268042 RepID=A0A7C9PPP2_9MICO|nr:LacI family DNA-binding transcriptional regulator [Galbitalea soli]NEM92513.1 LacI family transcriptional regulator [Galbitalea soli]NYJ29550.1 LacI family transcriptional regulator [Galbitalea soli]
MAAANVKDVAALARVSIGTVSNVLNRPEIVSPETAERVMQAIEKLGFVRNDAARQLKAGRSNAIGLVLLDGANPFFTEMATAAEDGAARAGFSVIVGNSNEKKDRESGYLNLFEEQRVRGILISPVGNVAPRLRRIRDHGIPVVLVDRTSPDSSFSSVSVDDVTGGAVAVTHLIDSGRRRIAFVGGAMSIRQVSDRLQGARIAVGMRADVSLEVITTAALVVSEGREAGRAIARRPASERPDAIFAANDLVAIGLLQGLLMEGRIAIPDQIAVIGYDDIPFADASVVALSSIRQPTRLIGETAVEILLEEADDPTLEPRHVVYQPELVIRDSSGGPAA